MIALAVSSDWHTLVLAGWLVFGGRLHDGDYLAVGYGEIQPLGNRGRLFTIP